MSESLIHDTITISKTINAPLNHVFAAWEDPVSRAIWGPPSKDEAMEFIENDFREGGCDVHRCGQQGELSFRVETRYYHIERPQRLLFTERVSKDERLLSAALISVLLSAHGGKTVLDLTVQLTSLVGRDMIEGVRGGWKVAVNNLARELEKKVGEYRH